MLLWIPSLSLRVAFCTPLSEIILMAACTAGDWFQLQCITMGFHKKSLLQRDKNLIEFLKAEGWAFWIFPACAAWRQQIKDGICGDYSQMACNEWLSFPLMVSKRQSKKHDVSNIWEWLQVALLRPAVCCWELRRTVSEPKNDQQIWNWEWLVLLEKSCFCFNSNWYHTSILSPPLSINIFYAQGKLIISLGDSPLCLYVVNPHPLRSIRRSYQMLSVVRAYRDSASTSIHDPRLKKKSLNELLDGTTFQGALGVMDAGVKNYSNAFGGHQELVSEWNV